MYNKTIIEFGFRMISCSTSSNNSLVKLFTVNFNKKRSSKERHQTQLIMHILDDFNLFRVTSGTRIS